MSNISNLPHPLKLAHMVMVAKLAAVTPPRIHVDPEPGEFNDAAEYMMTVAKLMDEWLLSVGHEIKANSTCSTDLEQFTDVFRDTIEGFAVHEVERAGNVLREDDAGRRADRARDLERA